MIVSRWFAVFCLSVCTPTACGGSKSGGGSKAAVPTGVELEWPDASTMVTPRFRVNSATLDAGLQSSDAMPAPPSAAPEASAMPIHRP